MKNQIKLFLKGVKSYRQAFTFLLKNKLLYFFLFPIAFNFLIYFSGLSVLNDFRLLINQYLESYLESFGAPENWWILFLNKLFSISIWLVSKVFFLYIFSLFGGYLTIIFLSPVFTYLSEKIASIQKGKTYNFNLTQFVNDVFRAILISFRNILIQLSMVFVLFLIGFIPVIGWGVSIFGNLLIVSYFYGFSFMDYTNERHQLSVKESVKIVRRKKGLAIGLGLVFYLCLFIPLLGGIISSFLAIISVVAATMSLEETFDN
ncbi:MAG: EI24 domain-containing protein [Flavobacteriales bacterium]